MTQNTVVEVTERIGLVLVEFQREWMDPEGKIHALFLDREQYAASVQNAQRVVSAARAAGMAVIHVGLGFSPGHLELGQARYGLRQAIAHHGTFPQHARGSEFMPPFVPQTGEFVVAGRTGASAFAGSNLDSYLRNNRISRFYLMGYALHVCVESTLRAAHDLGYDTTLIADACAAFSEQQQQHVLQHVVHHFGARVDSAEFVRQTKTQRLS